MRIENDVFKQEMTGNKHFFLKKSLATNDRSKNMQTMITMIVIFKVCKSPGIMAGLSAAPLLLMSHHLGLLHPLYHSSLSELLSISPSQCVGRKQGLKSTAERIVLGERKYHEAPFSTEAAPSNGGPHENWALPVQLIKGQFYKWFSEI